MTIQFIIEQLNQISVSLETTEQQAQSTIQYIQLLLGNIRRDAEAIRNLANQLQQQNLDE